MIKITHILTLKLCNLPDTSSLHRIKREMKVCGDITPYRAKVS